MKMSIVGCVFVLDSKRNENKKKNDIKTLKVLVNKKKGDLVRCSFDKEKGIKETLRTQIKEIIGSDMFHLEQVYTLGETKYYEDKHIDIIYMALLNEQSIKKLDSNYELVDFKIEGNNMIIFDDMSYHYKTNKREIAGSLEYTHKIDVDNLEIEKKLLECVIAYKHLRFRMDSTDVVYKLLPEVFTLEDVRIVYELIKDVKVDKSNFRKKIVKNCSKVNQIVGDKGYRPSQMYRFEPSSVEDWL